MDVTLSDPSGQPLQPAPGQSSQFTIPVPASMRAEEATLGTCPLWYYDTATGTWREERQGIYSYSPPTDTGIWRVFDLIMDPTLGLRVSPINDYVSGGNDAPKMYS
jgi:hypothetical protein